MPARYCQINSAGRLQSAKGQLRDRPFPFCERNFPQVSVMRRSNQMTTKVEQVLYGRVNAKESLALPKRFELPHSSFSEAGALMGKLRTIIGILGSVVNIVRQHFTMCYSVASELVGHDFSWLPASKQSFEKAPRSSAVPFSLKKYINHFAILVYCSPEIALFSSDFHEYLVDKQRVAETSVTALKSSSILGTKLDAPEADRFATNTNSPFGQEVFDVSMTEIEPVVEPDRVNDDLRRKPVSFVDVHRQYYRAGRVNLAVSG